MDTGSSPSLFPLHRCKTIHLVDNLRKHVHESGLSKRIELVITSPLLRALQTAVGVFGGEGYTDRMDILPLMVANAGYSERPSISSLNCPPIIAIELCREHLGVHPCDNRRSISDYQFLFPAVDFSLIESDEDILWKANVRELKEEVAARGLKFLNCFMTDQVYQGLQGALIKLILKPSEARSLLYGSHAPLLVLCLILHKFLGF
ncbi:hypothetical protein PRUPE_8G076400 [Prunus persica]|uniref:Uncharacterized protein n=1 Tax=Prunus persica TaxID=3760 RepID=A0A251MUR3_PRUPE|nr:hypothetical protein PRUPE_8G076400 [Prunus persica]